MNKIIILGMLLVSASMVHARDVPNYPGKPSEVKAYVKRVMRQSGTECKKVTMVALDQYEGLLFVRCLSNDKCRELHYLLTEWPDGKNKHPNAKVIPTPKLDLNVCEYNPGRKW